MDNITIRFFEPDIEMLMWLRNYIGKRIPIDIGCGGGDLLEELNIGGVGIDPFFTGDTFNLIEKGIHILPKRVQESREFIVALAKKGIFIFSRPCHSNFVEETIDMLPKGTECIYITKPENIELYCDLGRYDSKKKLLKHKGTSPDNEVVYSIIK